MTPRTAGERHIGIYATERIAKGTEITFDYQFQRFDEPIRCLCGAPNCRGIFGVNNDEENSAEQCAARPKVATRRYERARETLRASARLSLSLTRGARASRRCMDPVLIASAPATFTVATGDKTEALFAALRYRKGALDDRSVQAASEKGLLLSRNVRRCIERFELTVE